MRGFPDSIPTRAMQTESDDHFRVAEKTSGMTETATLVVDVQSNAHDYI
jgi:hypothetical protein